MTEAGAAIACHIAAHDTFAQAWLERLSNHATIFKVLCAAIEKIIKCQFLGCVFGRIQDPYRGVNRESLNFPDALATVAPAALDHSRTGGEPRRQFGAHRHDASM